MQQSQLSNHGGSNTSKFKQQHQQKWPNVQRGAHSAVRGDHNVGDYEGGQSDQPRQNNNTSLPIIGQAQQMNSSPSAGMVALNSNRKLGSGTFGATSRSMSVVHAQDGRRAMREGIDMLEARLLQKDKAAKANLLENRIKRLVFEEQRAKKLTDIANEKAEKLLKARDRHQKQLEEKVARENARMQKEQEMKERNRLMKELHEEKIRHSKFQIQQRTMGMKRVMVTQEKSLFERRIREEENDYYRKRQQRDEIDSGKRQFLQMKLESKRMIENQQRSNYQKLVEERNGKINKINEKVNQLEEVEQLLVEKLGMTQMNQHQALANLHKVVQICNSGININEIKNNQAQGRLNNINSNSSGFVQQYHTIQPQSDSQQFQKPEQLNIKSMQSIEQVQAPPLAITNDADTAQKPTQESPVKQNEVNQETDGDGMMITAIE